MCLCWGHPCLLPPSCGVGSAAWRSTDFIHGMLPSSYCQRESLGAGCFTQTVSAGLDSVLWGLFLGVEDSGLSGSWQTLWQSRDWALLTFPHTWLAGICAWVLLLLLDGGIPLLLSSSFPSAWACDGSQDTWCFHGGFENALPGVTVYGRDSSSQGSGQVLCSSGLGPWRSSHSWDGYPWGTQPWLLPAQCGL